MNRWTLLIAGLLALASFAQASDPADASALLERSIRHHDPEGRWETFAHTLVFEESRPDGTMRVSRVTIDLPGELFVHDVKTGKTHLVRRIEAGTCEASLDGSTSFTVEQAEEHRLSCDEIKRYRDYYTYLWGLPMKLRDPGTRLDPEIRRTTFADREVLAIGVTYDPDVGGDTWTFYFDPSSYALTGYRFHHDVSKNDGEYIILEGEFEIDGMSLPRSRTWYVNDDDRLLGTDTLVRVE